MNVILLIPLIAVVALGVAFFQSGWVNRQNPGNEKMQKITQKIAEGAHSFLRAEYKILALVVMAVAVLLIFNGASNSQSHALIALSFLVGAIGSALAGYFGMKIAVQANGRTTNAARESLGSALLVAFRGGSVMGNSVVGLGLLGLSGLFLILNFIYPDWTTLRVLNVLSGYSLGASSIALFARVGGGIFTKAADVGADLVGKVEAGIPEDHPLNPATIADNVGDNVGDVAGMGADLFESYVGALLGSMVLGAGFLPFLEGEGWQKIATVLLPLALAAVGILASLIGSQLVRLKGQGADVHQALNRGEWTASLLMIVGSFFVIKGLLPAEWSDGTRGYTSLNLFWAVVAGNLIGVLVGRATSYYTATGTRPVNRVVYQSTSGPATNIISGLGVGMESTAMPIILIVIGILLTFNLGGLYAVGLAAVGMLANTGIQLAIDAYGPIADNAGGIAEMAGLPPEVRERTDELDAVGNTTAAVGKGFAIASAAMTSLALFAAFIQQAGLKGIDLARPSVMSGLLLGAMLPYLFSAMAMKAVGRAAQSMILEVRRQFKSIPPLTKALEYLKKGEKVPEDLMEEAIDSAEYTKCVEISTKASLREMILPGVLAMLAPVVVGFMPGMGAEALGGLLAGVCSSGVLMAIFQSNAGGAWDNAKKSIEGGVEYEGENHSKGGDAHKASVVGDTVGDPLKDTSGPSLNILIKLICVVSLVLSPWL